MSEIVVSVGGMILSGWESFSVRHSMDSLCAEFDMEISDPDGAAADMLPPGAEVEILALERAGDVSRRHRLVLGYVDSVSRALSGSGSAFSVRGRDRLSDLVDCSAVAPSNSWTSARLTQIVTGLLSPFPVSLNIVNIPANPTITGFVLQSGESVFAAVERLCRSAAVLPLSDGADRLVLTSAQAVPVGVKPVLAVGANVISVDHTLDHSQRFSEYAGKSQTSGKGKKWSSQILSPVATATDAGVGRHRPMIFVAENKKDAAELAPRVNWEAQVRAGRANEYRVEVQDFFRFTPAGGIVGLWSVNTLCDLVVPRWGLREELLICDVAYRMSNGGRRTTLTLRDARTYAPNPGDRVGI